MHHFIYPEKDSFISSKTPNENYGLDEILRVGTANLPSKVQYPTTQFNYASTSSNLCVENFSGTISGSASGSVENGSGNFSVVYFSGSVDGSELTGSITGSGYSGSVSGSVNGILSSSFSGFITHFSGDINGVVSGSSTLSQSRFVTEYKKYVDRSIIKFNIDAIAESVNNNEIPMPKFVLHLKTARAENLPIDYTIYAMAVSQSWEMGNGYYWDGGSVRGVSWNYRDFLYGKPWSSLEDTGPFEAVDFIDFPERATASFARGGGTWWTSSIASQAFSYEASDIAMDVTSIVEKWISGSIPNEGFILVTSDELVSSGSEMRLHFFSKDTNTIYTPYLDAGWSDFTQVTGSEYTSSVTITTVSAGLVGTVHNGTITGTTPHGSITGVTNIIYTSIDNVAGAVNLLGLNGTISQSAIYGNVTGSISQSADTLRTSSILMVDLLDGYFSGSVVTASLDGVTISSGQLSGSWNQSQLEGNTLSASYPFSTFPTVFAIMDGSFIAGTVMGTYSTSNPTSSGTFDGVITDGLQVGSQVTLPFSGSVLTASYSYTSSVIISSQSLAPVEFNRPFVTVIQNLPSVVKSNNIIRVNVFAREEFPLKNFNRKTQFTQFLTSQYLPTASYYAIKDNETEEIVLDFDNYTQISCDEQGNYFLLDTSGLPQERYFKVLVKTEQSGSIYTFDRNDIFKIVR
jgi:hypothetical protein